METGVVAVTDVTGVPGVADQMGLVSLVQKVQKVQLGRLLYLYVDEERVSARVCTWFGHEWTTDHHGLYDIRIP